MLLTPRFRIFAAFLSAASCVAVLSSCIADSFNDACADGTKEVGKDCVLIVHDDAGPGDGGGQAGSASDSAGRGGASAGDAGQASAGTGGTSGTGLGKGGMHSAGAAGSSTTGGFGGSPAAGASGLGGVGGKAGQAGKAGMAGASGSAGTSGGGGANLCTGASVKCANDTTQVVCTAAGEVPKTKACPSGTPFCNSAAECVACKQGQMQCASKVPQSCGPDGAWVDGPACDVDCESGACLTVSTLSSGLFHSCISLSNGTARCWGEDAGGKLGGSPTQVGAVVAVAGLPPVQAVAAGTNASCGLGADGSVWCWGDNADNALGQDFATVQSSATPLHVGGIAGAIAVAMSLGDAQACAILQDHSVVCWGNGIIPPQAVPGLSNVASMAIGKGFACARESNSQMFCWGDNSLGQCGSGATSFETVSPPQLVKYAGLEVVAGQNHACSRQADQTVWCWGDDSGGQIADAKAPGPDSVTGVKALLLGRGAKHTSAYDGQSTKYWGSFGQGGVAPTVETDVGTPVYLAGGSAFACALLGPSKVAIRCWGGNDVGQLGQGDAQTYSTPVTVKFLRGYLARCSRGRLSELPAFRSP